MISPIVWATVVAVCIAIIGSICPVGPDKALTRVLVITGVVSVWLMWLIVYMSQMNPIIAPSITISGEK